MAPPGASGTMKRTGLLGHLSCAIAGVASRGNALPASTSPPAALIKLRRPMVFN
jgi:hypothetical protein